MAGIADVHGRHMSPLSREAARGGIAAAPRPGGFRWRGPATATGRRGAAVRPPPAVVSPPSPSSRWPERPPATVHSR
jgi:hypothetical protein